MTPATLPTKAKKPLPAEGQLGFRIDLSDPAQHRDAEPLFEAPDREKYGARETESQRHCAAEHETDDQHPGDQQRTVRADRVRRYGRWVDDPKFDIGIALLRRIGHPGRLPALQQHLILCLVHVVVPIEPLQLGLDLGHDIHLRLQLADGLEMNLLLRLQRPHLDHCRIQLHPHILIHRVFLERIRLEARADLLLFFSLLCL